VRARILSVLFGIFIAASLAAFPFWLDAPTGRTNPFDPKNPNHQSLPVAPAPAPAPDLLVKLYDNVGLAVPGAWVQVNNDSAGAKQSNSLGQASFSGLSFPVLVHVFPALSNPMGAISVVGVTGPVLELWSVGGVGAAGVTLTVSITHSGAASVGYYLNTFTTQGYESGSQGSGLSGNPANGTFTGLEPGCTANFMAFETDAFASSFTAAAFAPSVVLSGASSNVNLTTGPTGWTSSTFPVTVNDTLPTSGYYFSALAGASPSNFYTLPVISSYSSSSPTAVYGPVLLPSPLGFCGFGISSNTPGSPVSYSRYVRVTGTAAPASLTFDMPQPLQWTRSPTASDPHLTVLNPDPQPLDYIAAYIGTEWAVISLQPSPGQGLDVQYPTLPGAVTWLTPFAGPGPFNAFAFAVRLQSPAGQTWGYPTPVALRGNSVSVTY
jgi:hypothetical protein